MSGPKKSGRPPWLKLRGCHYEISQVSKIKTDLRSQSIRTIFTGWFMTHHAKCLGSVI